LYDCYRKNMVHQLGVADPPSTEQPILHESSCQKTVSDLTRVLSRALRTLGERGDAEGASRLAAQAWVSVRSTDLAAAERLAGVLHYLARLHPGETVEESAKEKSVSATDQLLDVRAEVPARRHDLIFETYTALSPGTAFVLVNDHDPKPLYYQFAAEHTDDFTWDYLEQGPEVWRVRIGRPEPTA
jgi:uncharacterized protein (DUF2249 family)